MEQRIVRNDIKNCTSIYFHPSYYLFSGKYIQSCSQNSNTLFKYPSVKYYLKTMARFSDDKVLVEDGKSILHILDLKSGTVLASQKMRRDVCCITRFAISNDEKNAFCIWLRGRKHELVIIDLSDLSYQVFLYPSSLCGVSDLICSKEHGLLVLETQVNDDRTCQNQVTCLNIQDGGCKATPLYTWSGNNTSKFFDGRYVWESGYKIRDLLTGDVFSLLENSDIKLPEKYQHLSHIYYPDEKCLQLNDGKHNIIIDCKQRKIIAQYLTDYQAGSYSGILVRNEFWIGKPDGIYAIPFPVIEYT